MRAWCPAWIYLFYFPCPLMKSKLRQELWVVAAVFSRKRLAPLCAICIAGNLTSAGRGMSGKS